MCGIVGIASETRIESRTWLSKGRDSMSHRGPDDAGEWWSSSGQVGFGHRRLAILDLSPLGHQPMSDQSGQCTITFNGEIYNYLDIKKDLATRGYIFRSTSDTEVILAAYLEWGEACLDHLNGMFAFAIYDRVRNQVFMARDRAGEKPFFYSLKAGTLIFASELKALLAHEELERAISPEALDLFLSMGYVPGESCIIKGVQKLPPAHAMIFDLDTARLRVWRYWNLPQSPKYINSGPTSDQELLSELEHLLEDSVRRQLVADVPVGVLLSGGVDSSLITAMAVRSSRKVTTFTMCFPDFGKFDESEHAKLISNHFGTNHIQLDAGSISTDLMPILARQYDEPIIDSSMIPTYLLSQVIKKHCTVALGGDGGDELFGGYSHYNRLLWTRENFGWVPLSFKKMIAHVAQAALPIGYRGRNWLQALNSDLQVSLPLIGTYFESSLRIPLLRTSSGNAWSVTAESTWKARIPLADDLLQRATRMEFSNYLPEDILVKIDRASMLQSLELRAPLLDYRIIEFAFGKVPTHLKATSKSRKILLKRLALKLLPPEFDHKRKQGFSIPLAAWLKKGPWRDYLQEILFDGSCIFDKKIVQSLFNGLDVGRNNQERIFGLALFELWRKEYQVNL